MASSPASRPRASHVVCNARISKSSRLICRATARAGQVLRAPNPRRRETPAEEPIHPVSHDDHQPGSDHGHSAQLAELPDRHGSSLIAAAEPAMPKQVLWRFVVPQYVTAFGEYLKVVGNIPELGQWDLGNAPPMEWREGHRWILETSLPIGCDFEFKVVALQHGSVRWEQGINRIVQSSDGVTGAPVELVINLTCQFGLTTETGMELVLNRSRVQESYELASATLELLGKRRERLAKALQELAKKGVAVAEQQEEAARLEAAVSTQAQCLSELGSLVANARPSEDGESLLLSMVGGKVVLPKEVSSLAWTQAKSVALVLEGAQQPNTPALPQPAAATETVAETAPDASAVSNNGHVADAAREHHVKEEVKQPAAVASSNAGIIILPYEEAKAQPVRRMSLLDTLIASYGNIVNNNGKLETEKTTGSRSETSAVGKTDGMVPLSSTVAAGAALSGTPNVDNIASSMESDSELDVDDAMAAAAYASLSSRKWAKRRSDRQIKAEQDAIAAAVAAYQTAYTSGESTTDVASRSSQAADASSSAGEPEQANTPIWESVTATMASAAGAVSSTVGSIASSFENFEQQRQPDAPGLTLAELTSDKTAPEQASLPEQATEPVAAVEQVVEAAVPALKEAKVEVPELAIESQTPEVLAPMAESEEQTQAVTIVTEDATPTTEEPIAPVLEALTSTVAETAGLQLDGSNSDNVQDGHATEAAIEALAGAAVAAAVAVDNNNPETILQTQEAVELAAMAEAFSGSPTGDAAQAALTNLLGGVNLPPPQQTSSGALFFSEAVLSAITLPPARPKPKKAKKTKRPSIWDNNGNGKVQGTYSQEERNRIADLALQLARLSSMITSELQSVVSTSDTAQKIGTWDRLDGMVQEAQALQERLMGQAGISISQEEELTQLQDLIKFAKEKLARRQSQLRNKEVEAVP